MSAAGFDPRFISARRASAGAPPDVVDEAPMTTDAPPSPTLPPTDEQKAKAARVGASVEMVAAMRKVIDDTLADPAKAAEHPRARALLDRLAKFQTDPAAVAGGARPSAEPPDSGLDLRDTPEQSTGAKVRRGAAAGLASLLGIPGQLRQAPGSVATAPGASFREAVGMGMRGDPGLQNIVETRAGAAAAGNPDPYGAEIAAASARNPMVYPPGKPLSAAAIQQILQHSREADAKSAPGVGTAAALAAGALMPPARVLAAGPEAAAGLAPALGRGASAALTAGEAAAGPALSAVAAPPGQRTEAAAGAGAATLALGAGSAGSGRLSDAARRAILASGQENPTGVGAMLRQLDRSGLETTAVPGYPVVKKDTFQRIGPANLESRQLVASRAARDIEGGVAKLREPVEAEIAAREGRAEAFPVERRAEGSKAYGKAIGPALEAEGQQWVPVADMEGAIQTALERADLPPGVKSTLGGEILDNLRGKSGGAPPKPPAAPKPDLLDQMASEMLPGRVSGTARTIRVPGKGGGRAVAVDDAPPGWMGLGEPAASAAPAAPRRHQHGRGEPGPSAGGKATQLRASKALEIRKRLDDLAYGKGALPSEREFRPEELPYLDLANKVRGRLPPKIQAASDLMAGPAAEAEQVATALKANPKPAGLTARAERLGKVEVAPGMGAAGAERGDIVPRAAEVDKFYELMRDSGSNPESLARQLAQMGGEGIRHDRLVALREKVGTLPDGPALQAKFDEAWNLMIKSRASLDPRGAFRAGPFGPSVLATLSDLPAKAAMRGAYPMLRQGAKKGAAAASRAGRFGATVTEKRRSP